MVKFALSIEVNEINKQLAIKMFFGSSQSEVMNYFRSAVTEAVKNFNW